MRVTEKLLNDNSKKNKNVKITEPDEVEIYMKREVSKEAINKRQSAFSSKLDEGINVSKSVFDKKAVFKTNN